MKITGIICEYNPLHLGHAKQLQLLRETDPDMGIVCLMSGNYVQRGMPAIFDKKYRAEAALACGADLVLELPVTACLSSAEGFAAKGVAILGSFCNHLCFGAETPDASALLSAAQALLSPEFPDFLRCALSTGISFPAARQQALERMGASSHILTTPNNILAVEYCKAILAQNSHMQPWPILRPGSYHDTLADMENPSATAVRKLILEDKDCSAYMPEQVVEIFRSADIHTLSSGEGAMLYRLRTMTDEEYEALPYGSEGLWRKLMKNARSCNTLEQILTETKSKRYTRTRLDRMVMCAFLGITGADLQQKDAYGRVLALNDRGRKILSEARRSGYLPNIGEKTDLPFEDVERRCDDLYGLFTQQPEPPGISDKRRIHYKETIL